MHLVIRKAALLAQIPYTTTLSAAEAAAFLFQARSGSPLDIVGIILAARQSDIEFVVQRVR